MAKYYVLYHELSGNNRDEEKGEIVKKFYPKDELIFQNVMGISDYKDFFLKLFPSDNILLVGGDGTINQFINRTADIEFENEVYYYPAGSGNDFIRDIDWKEDQPPVAITKYLKHLPVVTVKGNSYHYINGIGFGIDGYCCEVGDEMKLKSDKPVNYTSIAIKGLLFHYKPCNAVITVDGVRHEFKKVWLAPTMNGRFYGGGMMAAPKQDRLNPNGTQSVMLFYGKGKILTLMAFPKIFSGEHVNKKNMVAVLTGNSIKVEFDSPRALQIDGETIKDVTSYEVIA